MAIIIPFPTRENVQNRREMPRLPLRLQVEYGTVDDFLIDYSRNVSLGGMSISTDQEFAVGTALEVRFTLPVGGGDLPGSKSGRSGRGRSLSTGATVQWSVPGRGVGVRFDGFSPEDTLFLEELLAGHTDDPEPRLGRIVRSRPRPHAPR